MRRTAKPAMCFFNLDRAISIREWAWGDGILGVKSAHDEAKERLAQQAKNHGVLRTEVVDNESADDRPRHVEETKLAR